MLKSLGNCNNCSKNINKNRKSIGSM